MRHDKVNGDDKLLARGTMVDRPSGPDLKPETLDNLILRARRMRAEALADLLSRLGAAMVRPFRGRALPKLAGVASRVEGEPQRAV